jgi:hypothetical protein
MALLLVPFFMPLLLLGWVLTSREERAQRLLDSEREQLIAESWGLIFGRESQLTTRARLFEESDDHSQLQTW